MITVKHLRKEYSNATPLKDVNVEINAGDVISIIGPSGTGKSTFLRMLNQLEKQTSGEIWFEGECITEPGYDITKARQKMAMVFQSFNLYESLSIVENIMVGPVRLKGVSKHDAYQQAIELLKKVGLEDKAFNYPDELSGGQKQRVAIARAIAMQPKILLLDEPTSALDPKMIQEVQSVIAELAHDGMTMMIITHEMGFARSVANRVFYMDEGIIYEQGTPDEIFNHPQKPKTQEFVRKMNMLQISINTNDFNVEELLKTMLEFTRNNTLTKRGSYQLNLIFEELVINTIITALPLGSELNVKAEYLQSSQILKIDIEYPGDNFNPLENGDELSALMVKSASDTYFHNYNENINKVRVEISL